MQKAKPVIKAAALDKKINSSMEALSNASASTALAITKKAVEAKKLTAEVKRHSKKKMTLTKRNKTATTKNKKLPNAANKKAAAAVVKELNSTKAALDKSRANKAVVTTELAALRAAAKRLNAYTKAIAAADKVLNKPVKKKRIAKK